VGNRVDVDGKRTTSIATMLTMRMRTAMMLSKTTTTETMAMKGMKRWMMMLMMLRI
jgi:hypothetical protein